MHYTLLIYQSPDEFAARTDPARQGAFWAGFLAYYNALKEAGVVVSGAGLQTPDTATTVQFDKGQRLVQDGPYAETKEQLGGLFVIDVPNLDAALDWASRYATAPGRVIEVRPNLAPKG